ncbi:hypothetical protein BDY21DRAFT_385290 [Lineolata rhizophorae]|uniref:Altered inheritance of mitochondria protein 13, mitochondrial n=1 Tax=Lineolata rhizophorae TaxID=578093 RepID=A0A6A6P273_9PEZI|nr:hypothetical protein BDY21DRAFT_385290 [Lineolata rhizophorae]
MGANGSKEASNGSTHVFSADAPVRFSNELVEQLQQSPESDTTRARATELKLQSRLAAELEKLQADASSALTSALNSADGPSSPSPSSDSTASPASPSLVEKAGSALGLVSSADESRPTRDAVAAELAALRRSLEARKEAREPDGGVRAARDDVVACLRAKDRRPLDCWREVEAFKREVGRLEKEFVERVVR